jgi:hypothetical protein
MTTATSQRGSGNFKVLELQGIIGSIQLKKLPQFVDPASAISPLSSSTWRIYRTTFPCRYRKVILPGSRSPSRCRSAWPGRLIRRIEAKGIQTRLLFAGNGPPSVHEQSDCYIPYR